MNWLSSIGSEIELTQSSVLDFVRLPSSVELIPRIKFDWVRLSSISERSIDYVGKGEWLYNYSPVRFRTFYPLPIKAVSSCQNPLAGNKSTATMEWLFHLTISNCMKRKVTTSKPSEVQEGRRMRLALLRFIYLFIYFHLARTIYFVILRLSHWNETHGGSAGMNLLVKRVKDLSRIRSHTKPSEMQIFKHDSMI